MARVNKQDEKKTENPVPIITRPRESSGGNASRLMPRAAFSKTFEYTSDFDKNGIMWYIGTKEGKEPWSNPAIRGRVRISSSSVQKGDVVSVLEYEPGKQFWTMDVPSSWIQISLSSTKTVIPNYYTIRHGGIFGNLYFNLSIIFFQKKENFLLMLLGIGLFKGPMMATIGVY